MRKMQLIFLVLIPVGILPLILVGYLCLTNPFYTPDKLLKETESYRISTHHTNSKRPLSLTEAQALLPKIAFPPHAREIRFAEYSEFLAYAFLLRLEAPVDECRQAALDCLREAAREGSASTTPTTMPTASSLHPLPWTSPSITSSPKMLLPSTSHPATAPSPGGLPLSGPSPMLRSEFGDVDISWFTPDSIVNGVAGSFGRTSVYVDTDRGILYIMISE